jgi:hypothetical protein
MTGTSTIPVMAAIIVALRFRLFVRRFIDTGTTNPQAAKTPEELNIRRRILFNRLLHRGVLIETSPGRFYLDEINLIEYKKVRRTWALIILGILIIIILLDLLLVNNQI